MVYAPTKVPFVDGLTAIQCWVGQSGQPGTSIPVSLFNQDLLNPVYYGYDTTITVGGSNASVIDPLGTATLDGSQNIFVIAAAGTADLEVTPGLSATTAGPAAVAESIIESGLATLIAESIAETGLPLIGNPVMLYNVSAVQPATGAGLVGGTVPAQSYGAGCYNSDLTGPTKFDQGDSRFLTVVGRGSAGNRLTVTKKFWNPSDWSQTKNNMANYATYGTKVVVCLRPVITKGLAGGSDFTLVGTTAQKNAAIADKASLATFLAFLTGLGFTAQTCQIVLEQEPGNADKGISSTDYGNDWKTYGPTVNASGFPAVINVNYTGVITRATDYANAALGLRGHPATGVTFAGIAMDWYTNSYEGGNMLTTTDANGDSIISIADAHGLAFGVNEFGCVPAQFGMAQCKQYLTDDPVNSLLAVMSGRLQAGKPNLDCIYYDGQCDANGAGDITSPLGQDPTTGSPDPRVVNYQELFDTLTATPTTAFTINANSTVTLPPITPSPIGSLAGVDYISYEVALGLTAGIGSTNPFISLTFLWFDFDQKPADQTPIAKEVWHIPMGANGDANGPLVVYGGGRQHGGFLQIKVNNQDSVACTLNFFQFAGTSRVGARSSLTWNPNANISPAVPGFTLSAAADQSLQIGREYNVTLTPGQTKSFINGLWAGEAYFRCHVTGAVANDVQFELQPLPAGVFGASTDIFHQIIGAAGNIEVPPTKLALPRGPTVMTITNNDTNTVTAEYLLTAVETS